MSGDEVMKVMTKAYDQGKHVEDERVRYEEIDGLRISFDDSEEDGRWRRICVDGKIIRVEKGGWVEVTKEDAHVLDIVCGAEHAWLRLIPTKLDLTINEYKHAILDFHND